MKSKYSEVALVNEVKNCRACKWFWEGVLPYGDFPLYDWNEDFPKEVEQQEQTLQNISAPLLTGQMVGQGQSDPGVMHGCRKAPIMTIGINPNMTPYFPSVQGAKWCFHGFKKEERYAFYYRYHNVYQESVELEYIKKNIVPGTEIMAEKDGWLLNAERCSDHRWLLLTIQYVGEDLPQEIEIAWTQEQRFVVLVKSGIMDNETPPTFKKGEIIGAKIAGFKSDHVQIMKNSTGYYQRFVFVLDALKKMVGKQLENVNLSISEDVCQHDMIACASPGWSTKYDIPTGKITHNCVNEKAFLIKQLYQTQPAVIVMVGSSAMEMFASIFKDNLRGIDPETETFQLLKETTERKYFLEIDEPEVQFKSRVILSPHFSYYENFITHARLSAGAWQAFKKDFAKDYATLLKIDKEEQQTSKKNRIKEDPLTLSAVIRIDGLDDKIKEKLSTPAWQVLTAYYFDPIAMIAKALEQEYKSGHLKLDKSTQHFVRTKGECHFCDNDCWKFPGGCKYDGI